MLMPIASVRAERSFRAASVGTRHTSVKCSAAGQDVLDRKFGRLVEWISGAGGFVHDSLRLQKYEKPPFLSAKVILLEIYSDWCRRSLRTKYDVKFEDVATPCIAIPSSLVINRQKALESLENALTASGCAPIYARPTAEVIAVFIAYHKHQGENSDWYPAIDSLLQTPPCPWLKQVRDLSEIEFDEELQETIRSEKSGNDLIVKQLHTLYGEPLGLSRTEMLWAYATAQSVCLIDNDGMYWLPVVNFVLHDRSEPPLYIHERGRFVTWGWQDRPITAGEHLKMNIGIERPLLLYLSRGIVTDNL